MSSFTDELKCPDCGQIFKLKGVELTGMHGRIYYNHFGSLKCRWQKELGMQLTKSQSFKLIRMALRCDMRRYTPVEQRPLCGCGCGERVNYDPRKKMWRRFIYGHSSRTLSGRRLQTVLEQIVSLKIENQVDLKRLSHEQVKPEYVARSASRLAKQLVKLGVVRREKTLVNGKWCYRLIIVGSVEKVMAHG